VQHTKPTNYYTISQEIFLSGQRFEPGTWRVCYIFDFKFILIHIYSHYDISPHPLALPLFSLYRGADKSLARPGRKQANVSDRMACISFGALPCRKKKWWKLASTCCWNRARRLTCFRGCFLPGWARDLSAPRLLLQIIWNKEQRAVLVVCLCD